MPDPLSSIPSLIPLPAGLGSSSSSKDTEDPFSSLFSTINTPSSPRIFTTARPTSNARFQPPAASPASPGSEFGSFVSVSASEDPLQQHTSYDFTPSASVSPVSSSVDFFGRFGEEARERAEKNERRVIDELLAHEDDPLYWLELPKDPPNSRSGSGASTRTASPTRIPPRTTESPSPLIDLDAAPASPRQSRHPSRRESATAPASTGPPRATSPRPTSASPSRRPVTRASSSSLSRSWMSTLLSTSRPSPARTATASPSPDGIQNVQAQALFTKPAPQTSLPTLSTLPSHAPTSALPIPARKNTLSTITHGTPFASHPFTPSTGAPGFAGDRNWNKGFEFDREDVESQSVRLVGRKMITTPVLTVQTADAIRAHLPALSRLPSSWSLLYSLDQHGISLNTLYTRCAAHAGGALVALQDSAGGVFGAWVSEGVHLSKGTYYGSGDAFLWSAPRQHADGLRVYKWTGKNDYVALCEPEYISFGGGEGHYGLYLDDTLIDGTSHPCPTFGNECLARGERRGDMVKFECVGLEVWGVDL